MSGAAESSVANAPAAWFDRAASLRRELATLEEPSYRARLAAFETLSDRLLRSSGSAALTRVPGLAFLAAFLRASNLDALVSREIADARMLDGFVPSGERKSLMLVPRGVVCHWIAGNVPLLGMFSWAVSALAGNANVIRLSSRQDDFVTPLLNLMAEGSAAGAAIASRTIVVRFDRDDLVQQRQMSELADVRIAWGGQEAVEAIQALPARWETDTIIFGPRVSFAVLDPAVTPDKAIGRLVTDIVYFDQLACSSPQRLFVKGEPGEPAFDAFMDRLTTAMARESRAIPRAALDFSETYRVQLDRTRVLLEGGTLRCGPGTSWTIAVVPRPTAAVTCMNRFVEVIPFRTVTEVLPRIPAQVQTAVTLLDADDFAVFTTRGARQGICRFPRPGDGNGFETPWDGVPLFSRLARWVTRTEPA